MDLLDFYRGTLSGRRLSVLVRQLSVNSSLVRAMNDGRAPMSLADHLLADQWVMLDHIRNPKSKVTDHPTRAEMEAKRRKAAKQARVVDLRVKFEQRKHKYGLG